ncbi:nitroreductase family protein [Acetobacterium bakii]|uniref:Putative nitroreductase TM1586 domain-containing protein n=1 Tax=Acetobacterium bakii TaxID=52689 RepID=A0A0L6U077_9FIRM|nr:nitroreductase family protein [Acetobacterium bakii]KNZ41888.1 hypothetical protein AKG39_09750 [Acetobacterium bakii]
MDYKKAIENRRSRRTYLDKPISQSSENRIRQLIAGANEESGLHMQLQINNGNGLSGIKMSYGMFKNVHHYIALVGKKDDPELSEKLGYCGEKIVLEATLLNLGTCWVGGTYDKKSCDCEVGEDETLLGIITIGYTPEKQSLMEKAIHSIISRKTKKIEDMLTSDVKIPQWMVEGMQAVQKAPSAVNKQPVQFTYNNGKLTAQVKLKLGYEMMDLGIAKLHFEIGSDYFGKWERGNGKEFLVGEKNQ